MRNPMLWLVAVAVLALGIRGFVFLDDAAGTRPLVESARTFGFVAGITCLVIAVGLLVFGMFVFRRRDEPPPERTRLTSGWTRPEYARRFSVAQARPSIRRR